MTRTSTAHQSTKTPMSRKRVGGGPAEPPLLWLSRRKDRHGDPLIGPAEYAAGERLAADLMRGAMLPGVTMQWSAAGKIDRSVGGQGLTPTEAMTAARQRATRALDQVGPEMAGPMIDLCGFCKGLEQIEFEREWPARSAKLMARVALAQLARHYGLSNTATGKVSRGPYLWREAGARPSLARTIATHCPG
jgi:hypothetical protein